MCALQCDKMGVKWNSRFKKERGLDFGETQPSGSASEKGMQVERDDAGSEGEPEKGSETCLRKRKMKWRAQGTEVGRIAGVKGKEMDEETFKHSDIKTEFFKHS